MRRSSLISKSSITAFQGSETVYEKTVSAKVKRFPRWHSKSPASVLLDNSMSDLAFRVYCAMGLKTDKGACSVGVRYLGRILGTSATTISRRILELVAAGHLEPLNQDNGQRASYRFTSPAYQRICRECKHFAHVGESGRCWVCDELAEKTA